MKCTNFNEVTSYYSMFIYEHVEMLKKMIEMMVGKCHNRWISLSAGCRTTRSMTTESIIKAVPLSHGHFELTNRSNARRGEMARK